MSVPKYDELEKPVLLALQEGVEINSKELRKRVASFFRLSDADLSELLPSGRQTIFANRVGWAATYLKKAGLIVSPARATFLITEEGKKVLRENPDTINNEFLMRYESFCEFTSLKKPEVDTLPISSAETPDDTFEESFRRINDNLADEILSEVVKLSPTAFEQLIIDLLYKMGYGEFENSGKTTAVSGDEGIDGIIMEDKLGFSLIYIQAKKWDVNSTVGRPDVQSFVGAISGRGGKGLFVTTAKFSKQASDYAARQHIILIDGEKLSRLMIEHNFCVTVKKTFEIKAIDTDAFNDYAD